MHKVEFAAIRRKLRNTHKELALLPGLTVKAVQSNEQAGVELRLVPSSGFYFSFPEDQMEKKAGNHASSINFQPRPTTNPLKPVDEETQLFWLKQKGKPGT